MLYKLQKIGYFQILVLGLKLNISGTLPYSLSLVLFNEKKKKKNRVEMKSDGQFLVRNKEFYLFLSLL
jgi:hypothetical protein